MINSAVNQGCLHRSQSVWKTACQPVLQAAGLRVESVETRWPKHAFEMAQKATVKDFDALACVGGDGTMSEILQVIILKKSPVIFEFN